MQGTRTPSALSITMHGYGNSSCEVLLLLRTAPLFATCEGTFRRRWLLIRCAASVSIDRELDVDAGQPDSRRE